MRPVAVCPILVNCKDSEQNFVKVWNEERIKDILRGLRMSIIGNLVLKDEWKLACERRGSRLFQSVSNVYF